MLVNIIQTFEFAGRRYLIGENPDIDPVIGDAWIADGKATYDPDGIQNPVGGASGRLTLNPTDITASRALASADFNGAVTRINAAGVVAVTLPTVAAMSLTSTPSQIQVAMFEVLGGGIPTFAGATASTIINDTAGTTTVLPGSSGGVGGAVPVTGGFYALVQRAVGGDSWSLF